MASKTGLFHMEIDASEVELLACIGEGGFSTVWEGRWHGCPVAVKSLTQGEIGAPSPPTSPLSPPPPPPPPPPSAAAAALTTQAREAAIKQLKREVELHKSLVFPLIVQLVGCSFRDPDRAMMVLELAPLG